MIKITSEPFYLFLHIPKTAGTTLRQIVDKQYGYANVLTYYNQNSQHIIDNLESLLIVHPNYKALIGHYNFGIHRKIAFPSAYITFLRHPIARTISQYKEWVKNHPERLLKKDGSTQTLIESINSNPESYRDFQCQYLAPSCADDDEKVSIAEKALHNLSIHFLGIGLVEYFDESISLLSNKLGWTPTNYDNLNVKNLDVEVSTELVELILSISKNDLFVYESIKKKLLSEFRA